MNEIYLNVEKRLKNICDEIRNKECQFLDDGDIIEKDKTLQQNNIHDGEKILINGKMLFFRKIYIVEFND